MIKFNNLRIDFDKNIVGGTPMYVNDIRHIMVDDSHLTATQMLESGCRTTNDTLDYKYWNGCHFEDIDYKVWIRHCEDNNIEYDDPQTVFYKVFNFLMNNYSHMFYYMEYSRSLKGFHIINYFNTFKSEDHWRYTKAISIGLVREAFVRCGYEEAIGYAEVTESGYKSQVMDICSWSPVQLCFFTGKGKINESCIGSKSPAEFDYMDIYDKMNEKKIKREEAIRRAEKRKECGIECKWDMNIEEVEEYDENKKYKYISHTTRWILFNSLRRIYIDKDEEEFEQIWKDAVKKIPEANGHTTKFYENEPYKNDWAVNWNEDMFCDTDLLEEYGYKVNIKKKEENMFDYFKML